MNTAVVSYSLRDAEGHSNRDIEVYTWQLEMVRYKYWYQDSYEERKARMGTKMKGGCSFTWCLFTGWLPKRKWRAGSSWLD